MENIYIVGSHSDYFIPTVNFNAQNGVCEISGESYLEETQKFYLPLIQWLKDYAIEVRKPLTFNFKITYFNTSSSKCIVDILNAIKSFENSGCQVVVNWFYDSENEDAEEELEEVDDFALEANISILKIPYNP